VKSRLVILRQHFLNQFENHDTRSALNCLSRLTCPSDPQSALDALRPTTRLAHLL
jgi:hypothetical protein